MHRQSLHTGNRFFISPGLSDNLGDRKGELRSFCQIRQWKNPPLKLCAPHSFLSKKVRCIIAWDLRIKKDSWVYHESLVISSLFLFSWKNIGANDQHTPRHHHHVSLSSGSIISLLSLSLICIFYFFACEKVSLMKASRLLFFLTWSEVLGVLYSLTLLVFSLVWIIYDLRGGEVRQFAKVHARIFRKGSLWVTAWLKSISPVR